MEHMTNKIIKQRWAEKLLSGEELTLDDRESIAYELGCTSLLEVAFSHLCQKLWLQSKPKSLKLTGKEREFLTKVFPRNKIGRKSGVTDATIKTTVFFDSIRSQHMNDKDAYIELADSLKIEDICERGKKALKVMKYDFANDDLVSNIQAQHAEWLMKSVLQEYFKPSHIEE